MPKGTSILVVQKIRRPKGVGTIDHLKLLLVKLTCDITHYAVRCFVCQRAKGTLPNVGLYTPLFVLTKPWNDVNMILYVVNRFFKTLHFVAIRKTMDATRIDHLLFKGIFFLHGIF